MDADFPRSSQSPHVSWMRSTRVYAGCGRVWGKCKRLQTPDSPLRLHLSFKNNTKNNTTSLCCFEEETVPWNKPSFTPHSRPHSFPSSLFFTLFPTPSLRAVVILLRRECFFALFPTLSLRAVVILQRENALKPVVAGAMHSLGVYICPF
jgi:hypothetical protein